ncbi:hypothetical protein PR003_g22004 [Phytophthora rubi]|uniref:Thioesterase domain-containing protein n=1 Tax=Phytophthora rubi TaxID=129364 RepID=A0A6A4DBX6_9STRA|nr:hypothetical protein PR003_g22004 [Phytophthora rubi]
MVGRIVWNIGAGLVHRLLHKASIRPGMGFAYPSVWRARPGFLDCDINLHLNNASYLFNMELARWHFCAVTGILGNVARHRRALLVASQALPAGRGRQLARQDGATVSAAKLYAEVFGGDAEALQALQTRDMPDVVKRLLEWDGAARVVLETPAEAARRERETTMPSAETLAGKKVLERASRSWNLPV